MLCGWGDSAREPADETRPGGAKPAPGSPPDFSRLVLELLAGRISQQQFQDILFGADKNLFELQLARGLTIQSSRVEKTGLDEDDDYLVFDLEPDFAASPLKKPEPAG